MFNDTEGQQLRVVKEDDTEKRNYLSNSQYQRHSPAGPFTASAESCLGCKAEDPQQSYGMDQEHKRGRYQAQQGLYLMSPLTDVKISVFDLLNMPVLNTDDTIAAGFAETHI